MIVRSVEVRRDDLNEAMRVLSESEWFKQFDSRTTPDWFVRLAEVSESIGKGKLINVTI